MWKFLWRPSSFVFFGRDAASFDIWLEHCFWTKPKLPTRGKMTIFAPVLGAPFYWVHQSDILKIPPQKWLNGKTPPKSFGEPLPTEISPTTLSQTDLILICVKGEPLTWLAFLLAKPDFRVSPKWLRFSFWVQLKEDTPRFLCQNQPKVGYQKQRKTPPISFELSPCSFWFPNRKKRVPTTNHLPYCFGVAFVLVSPETKRVPTKTSLFLPVDSNHYFQAWFFSKTGRFPGFPEVF